MSLLSLYVPEGKAISSISPGMASEGSRERQRADVSAHSHSGGGEPSVSVLFRDGSGDCCNSL